MKHKSVLQQLQSRIDMRGNEIRDYEENCKQFKGTFLCGTYKRELAFLVKEQQLDKKIYRELLEYEATKQDVEENHGW